MKQLSSAVNLLSSHVDILANRTSKLESPPPSQSNANIGENIMSMATERNVFKLFPKDDNKVNPFADLPRISEELFNVHATKILNQIFSYLAPCIVINSERFQWIPAGNDQSHWKKPDFWIGHPAIMSPRIPSNVKKLEDVQYHYGIIQKENWKHLREGVVGVIESKKDSLASKDIGQLALCLQWMNYQPNGSQTG